MIPTVLVCHDAKRRRITKNLENLESTDSLTAISGARSLIVRVTKDLFNSESGRCVTWFNVMTSLSIQTAHRDVLSFIQVEVPQHDILGVL